MHLIIKNKKSVYTIQIDNESFDFSEKKRL
jgi:hypothetical protein